MDSREAKNRVQILFAKITGLVYNACRFKADRALAASGHSSVVEHLLAKEEVMGSNPIARSPTVEFCSTVVLKGDVAKW